MIDLINMINGTSFELPNTVLLKNVGQVIVPRHDYFNYTVYFASVICLIGFWPMLEI